MFPSFMGKIISIFFMILPLKERAMVVVLGIIKTQEYTCPLLD